MIKLDHTIEALQLMLTLGLMYLSQLLVIQNHQCLIRTQQQIQFLSRQQLECILPLNWQMAKLSP